MKILWVLDYLIEKYYLSWLLQVVTKTPTLQLWTSLLLLICFSKFQGYQISANKAMDNFFICNSYFRS